MRYLNYMLFFYSRNYLKIFFNLPDFINNITYVGLVEKILIFQIINNKYFIKGNYPFSSKKNSSKTLNILKSYILSYIY